MYILTFFVCLGSRVSFPNVYTTRTTRNVGKPCNIMSNRYPNHASTKSPLGVARTYKQSGVFLLLFCLPQLLQRCKPCLGGLLRPSATRQRRLYRGEHVGRLSSHLRCRGLPQGVLDRLLSRLLLLHWCPVASARESPTSDPVGTRACPRHGRPHCHQLHPIR